MGSAINPAHCGQRRGLALLIAPGPGAELKVRMLGQVTPRGPWQKEEPRGGGEGGPRTKAYPQDRAE